MGGPSGTVGSVTLGYGGCRAGRGTSIKERGRQVQESRGVCSRLIALSQPLLSAFQHKGAPMPSPPPSSLAQHQALEEQFRLQISQSLISSPHQQKGLSESHLWLIAPKGCPSSLTPGARGDLELHP